MYDSDFGESGRTRLMDMGVDAVVESDADPDQFLDLVASLSISENQVIETVPSSPSTLVTERRITAIVGFDLAGDVALALSGSFAKRNQSTVLIDADTVSPMLAQRLSLPLVPNLLTALDALVQRRGDAYESLIAGPDGISLVLGLPEASEWETVRAPDVVDFVEQLDERFDEVLVKISPYIEDLSRFGGRVGRFEVARSLLRLAGDVALVADSTPLGLSRAMAWIATARVLTATRIHVLFADAPPSVFQRGELSEELTRSFIPASITWLPADAKRVRSVWNGQPIPAGSFTKAVGGLGTSMLNRVKVGAM